MLRGWRDASIETSHYVVPERTGTLAFRANLLAQQADPNGRRGQSSQDWATNYREQVIGRIQAYFLARRAIRGDELPGDPADLEHLINQLLPDFQISIVGQNPPCQIQRESAGSGVTDINQLSSGEAQLLTLSLDILTTAAIWQLHNTEERILLIDEPDAHIHPDLQARFADFIVRVGNEFGLQIVVATHSTTLLSALGQFGGEETGVFYLDRMERNFESTPFDQRQVKFPALLTTVIFPWSAVGFSIAPVGSWEG